MISSEQATARIVAETRPLPPRATSLHQAAGLVLAVDAAATTDVPPFAQSSMDGYALRHADREMSLPVIGESAAGGPSPAPLAARTIMRIFTGAPLPPGADSVVMQEHVERVGDRLRLTETAFEAGQHVRPLGAEARAGATALAAGTLLTPAAIGYLAMCGIAEPVVHPRPRIALIVTGDEIVPPGTTLAPGQVHDANSYAVAAALGTHGYALGDIRFVRDDETALAHRLTEALANHDVVLLTGGVSVGDHDHVQSAAGRVGIETCFHRVRQKPGKPLFFGKADGPLVFGLPGNPASVLTCLLAYVLPALDRLTGRPAAPSIFRPLGCNQAKPAGTTWFLKARLAEGKVWSSGGQESYRLKAFAEADCLIRLGEAENPRAGTPVVVLPLRPGIA